jgi:hypothetical protein
LSFTVTGADQVLPPSVDWVNLTSIWVPAGGASARVRASTRMRHLTWAVAA